MIPVVQCSFVAVSQQIENFIQRTRVNKKVKHFSTEISKYMRGAVEQVFIFCAFRTEFITYVLQRCFVRKIMLGKDAACFASGQEDN